MKGLGNRRGIPRPSSPRISRVVTIVEAGGEKLGEGGTTTIIVTSASCDSRGPIPRCPTRHNLTQFVVVAACIILEMRVLISMNQLPYGGYFFYVSCL